MLTLPPVLLGASSSAAGQCCRCRHLVVGGEACSADCSVSRAIVDVAGG